MEFLCELCEAQAACGRYFVHEQTSEVNSRMRCVTRIMAMSGTGKLVADLCMFRLAACDEASVRTVTYARQVGMRMQRTCTGTHRHARVVANNASEQMEQSGTWVCNVVCVMEEHVREDEQELTVSEQN